MVSPFLSIRSKVYKVPDDVYRVRVDRRKRFIVRIDGEGIGAEKESLLRRVGPLLEGLAHPSDRRSLMDSIERTPFIQSVMIVYSSEGLKLLITRYNWTDRFRSFTRFIPLDSTVSMEGSIHGDLFETITEEYEGRLNPSVRLEGSHSIALTTSLKDRIEVVREEDYEVTCVAWDSETLGRILDGIRDEIFRDILEVLGEGWRGEVNSMITLFRNSLLAPVYIHLLCEERPKALWFILRSYEYMGEINGSTMIVRGYNPGPVLNQEIWLTYPRPDNL